MAFKLKKDFGPKRLREVHAQLVDRLNEITPLPGLGVEVEQKPDGRQISAKEVPPGASLNNPEGGGGGGGTTEDIYGALNGQAAIFHVLVSAPAEPLL